jgi:hypothetical protein
MLEENNFSETFSGETVRERLIRCICSQDHWSRVDPVSESYIIL